MNVCQARVIVCATDLSETAREAVDAAFDLATRSGARQLHVLYVQESEERIETLDGSTALIDLEEEELRRLVDEELARLTASQGGAPALEVLADVRYGKPAHVIVKYAFEVNADLIVVGTHGRTGLRRVLSNSVAEHVVRHAACSVVVAKAPEVRAHLAELLRRLD